MRSCNKVVTIGPGTGGMIMSAHVRGQRSCEKSRETCVMFNNCHLGYSMKNALRLRELMKTEESG